MNLEIEIKVSGFDIITDEDKKTDKDGNSDGDPNEWVRQPESKLLVITSWWDKGPCVVGEQVSGVVRIKFMDIANDEKTHELSSFFDVAELIEALKRASTVK